MPAKSVSSTRSTSSVAAVAPASAPASATSKVKGTNVQTRPPGGSKSGSGATSHNSPLTLDNYAKNLPTPVSSGTGAGAGAGGGVAASIGDDFSKTAKSETAYTSADIQVLEGIAAIRHRPGMYIGATTTSGLLHLIWEALDNAIDEFNAGYGKNIWLTIDANGWVTLRDEGRGMPFDPMVYQGQELPAATVILTVPHSGGKFEEGAYKTAGGLHGVGTTVINALSERLELTIWKGGKLFTQTFERGVAHSHTITPCEKKLHGTQLRWMYDRTIFERRVGGLCSRTS
jgi:hypothetical protein